MTSPSLLDGPPALTPGHVSAGDQALHTLDADAALVVALFDAHAPALLRCIRGFGLDTATAEDVLQETFVALHRHLQQRRPRSNMVGWLFQVSQNLSRREHRRRRRGVQAVAWSDAATDHLVDPHPSPELRFLEHESGRLARAAVRALPDRDQECLRLRAEGLRYRAIASALGISLGSVAKSVSRGLAHLSAAAKG